MAGEITVAHESPVRTINAVSGVSRRTFAASISRNRTSASALSGVENRANSLLKANAVDYTLNSEQRERNSERIRQAARNMSYRIITESRNQTKAKETPRVALKSISVDDSNWRFTSGRRRPSGRGTWAFSIGSKEAFNDVDKAFWYSGSYTEAVKEAKKEAQRRGATRVYVMG